MPTYVIYNGELIDKRDRPEGAVARAEFPTPAVKGFQEYRSPIDGRLITCPKQRRDDLRAHGCVEWEPGINQSATKGRRNMGEGEGRRPDWSRKHNRPIKDGLLVK